MFGGKFVRIDLYVNVVVKILLSILLVELIDW